MGIPLLRPAVANMLCCGVALPGDGGLRAQAGAAARILPVGLAFLAKTVAETGRLRLFYAPLLAPFAAREIAFLFPGRPVPGLVSLPVVQSTAIRVLKVFQDLG